MEKKSPVLFAFCVFSFVFLFFSGAGLFAGGKGEAVPDTSAESAPVSGAPAVAPRAERTPLTRIEELIRQGKIEDAKMYFISNLGPNDKAGDGKNAIHYAALAQDSALIDFFIRLGTLPDVSDDEGRTPLTISAGFLDAESAKILVVAGANIHHKPASGDSVAQIAIAAGDSTFLSSIITENSLFASDENGNTLLHLAADSGDASVVQTILKALRGTNLAALASKKNSAGKTALDLCFAHRDSRPHADTSVFIITAGGNSSDPFYPYFAPAVRSQYYNQRASNGVSPLHFAVRERYTGWTDYLLDNGADPNIKNTSGDTPLIESARIGDIDTLRKLMQHGANVDVQDAKGNTAMHIAIPAPDHREALEILLANGGNPNIRDERGDSPAHIVIALRRPPDVLEVLLLNKADVSIHNIKGETPLFTAVDKDCAELIPPLLASGADIFAATNTGITPFQRALQKADNAVLQEIITESAVRQNDSGGNTPLIAAVKLAANPDIIRLILDKNALVNARNQEGDTALHIAIKQNNAATGEMLLARNADIFLQNAKGESPLYLAFFSPGGPREWLLTGPVFTLSDAQGNTILHQATQWQLDRIIPIIVRRGAKVEAQNALGETPLFMAVRINSAPTIRSLLSAGASLNARDSLGNTVLHVAVRWEAQSAAEALIGAKIDIDAYNLYGNTALHDAVKLGRSTMENLLVQRGAGLEMRDVDGNTPLMTAVVMGNFRSADHLARSGADINTRNNNGETPLLLAVENERSDLVALLLDRGAQIHARDADGKSPFIAALQTSQRMVLSLLGKGREQTDDAGRSPLSIALVEKRPESEIEAITSWAGQRQLSIVDGRGWIPLRYAVDMENWEAAKFLSDQGSNAFSVGRDGKTPADIVLERGNQDAIRALFGGKSINARDTGGNTALHYTAKIGNTDTIKFLLELGADKTIRNTAGETAADIARRWKHEAAADML
ncbi:MAG: ankyrin repeat domain-containing protein [Spirochaetaceae bacterium]|nr:ankyrin repeat domain-containing protein [Spirochaetaceae bacterium]